MAARVIARLRTAGIPFVVAPYEADAQLAVLGVSGEVDAVLTEDSDLLAYGTPRVLFKLAPDGSCVEVCAQRLGQCSELNMAGWDGDMFTQLCVLAGCDYAPSVPGVGIKKAATLVRRFRTAAAALRHLRFQGAPVPRGHEQTMQAALWTFAHAWVYDPATRGLVHRTPRVTGGMPDGQVEALLGKRHADDVAIAIAEGLTDPITLEPFPPEDLAPMSAMPPPPPSAQQQREQQQMPRIDQFFGRSPGPVVSTPRDDLTPVPSKRARRQRAQADKAAAAGVSSLVDDLLGDLGGPPPPTFIPLYSNLAHPAPLDGEGQSSPSGGSDSRRSVDPSPARPHRFALARGPSAQAAPAATDSRGAHRPQPLHPRPGSVLNVPQPVVRASKFFSPRAPAAAPAADLDGDEDVEAATPAGYHTPHHAATPRSLRGVDLSHVRGMAASAPAVLDRFDSYKRPGGVGETPAPPTAPHSAPHRHGAAATPIPFESFKFSGGGPKRAHK
jgi:hypothetical protein